MIYCPQCGKPNEDGTQFCSECGAKIESLPVNEQSNTVVQQTVPPVQVHVKKEMFCRNCGSSVLEGAFACLGCGLPPMKGKSHCQSCGATTHPDAIICIKCGAKLGISPFSTSLNIGLKDASLNLGNKAGLVGGIMVFVGFFMPWLDMGFFGSFSGYNAVFGSFGKEIGEGRFLMLILPISAGLFLFHLFTQKLDKGFADILKISPIIFIFISAIIIYAKLDNGRNGNFDEMRFRDASDIFKIIGIGFWFTFIGAFVMCFHKDNKA